MVASIVSWLRRIWRWLGEIPTFWAFLVVLTLATWLPLLLVTGWDDALRYGGLVLQLVGVGVVAFTLRGRGRLFGRTPVIVFAREWIRRAPSFRPRTITLEATGIASASAFGTADATVWRGPRLEQSVEAQLEAIRANLDTLREQLDAHGSRTNSLVAELRTAIDAERAQRTTEISETKRKLEGLAADSLYLEVAGLGWLVSGIVLATVPAEIAALFRWAIA